MTIDQGVTSAVPPADWAPPPVQLHPVEPPDPILDPTDEPALDEVILDESLFPIDLEPVLAGSTEQPLPDMLLRDDGQALLYPGAINGVHGDSGSGKGWVVCYTIRQNARVASSGRSRHWTTSTSSTSSRPIGRGDETRSCPHQTNTHHPHQPDEVEVEVQTSDSERSASEGRKPRPVDPSRVCRNPYASRSGVVSEAVDALEARSLALENLRFSRVRIER